MKPFLRIFILVMVTQFSFGTLAFAEVDSKEQGDRFLKRGETSLAVEKYQEALKISPDSAIIYFNLAIAYYAERRLEEAAGALEKVIEINPEDTEARYNLGCLSLYQGEWEKALIHFQNALKCCENDPQFEPLIHQGLELIDRLKSDLSTQDLLSLLTQYGLPPLSV